MPHLPGSTIKPLVKLPRDGNDCWTYLGPVAANGHAIKTVGGKSTAAARWMWAQLFGPVPVGMVVFHTCGTKTCINPLHLRCGSQAEACREGPGTAAAPIVLTPCDVRELRLVPKADRTAHRARILADHLGCCANTVRSVWSGSSWSRPRPNHGPKRRAG